MHGCLHIKKQILIKVEFSQQALLVVILALDKTSRKSVYGRRIVLYGRTDKRRDMTTHILCYSSFVKAPEQSNE